MKRILFIMPLMAISLLANCGGDNPIVVPDLYIKLRSSNCELRETIDSKGVDSIKFKKGSKNLDFYIYPTDKDSEDLHIDIISISAADQDFSEHYQETESFHFVTDDTELLDDLIITANATDTFKVTFHANDGKYSDGSSSRVVRGVLPGETFGEVEKRLTEKPTRNVLDKIEGWTDIDKWPIKDDLIIESDIIVFANFRIYSCYAMFIGLNEYISESNMEHYGDRTYALFNPGEQFVFTFEIKKGYKLSETGLVINDEIMPDRIIPFTVEGNSLLISAIEVSDHNLIISVPNVDLVEYDVYKPTHDYLTIDDSGYENPTIESEYKAVLTFKEGFKIPTRDMAIVTIDGEIYKDFIWNKIDSNKIQLGIPSGVICGVVAYDVESYEFKVTGIVINTLSPLNRIAGMRVTLTSNNEAIPYVATTSTDENGNYAFYCIEDTSYTISIDLNTGVKTDEQWVSNNDTLTITAEEIKKGAQKLFYVANYNVLTTKTVYIKVNNNYSSFDISAYGGLAKAIYNDVQSRYEIDLKSGYDTNLLFKCKAYQPFSRSLGILDMPTTIVPVDMSEITETIDINLNAYHNYNQTSSSDPSLVCVNIKGGSYGFYLASSRLNNNFAFMIHSPALQDGSIYRLAFTTNHTVTAQDASVFIITFTSLGKILSITDGNGKTVDNSELIQIYTHPGNISGTMPAIEIVTTVDFIREQGSMVTDTQDIYFAFQSERNGFYGSTASSFDNPSTYKLIKANGSVSSGR